MFKTKHSDEDAEALRRIDNVTPGDMAVVRQNLFYLASTTTNAGRR